MLDPSTSVSEGSLRLRDLGYPKRKRTSESKRRLLEAP